MAGLLEGMAVVGFLAAAAGAPLVAAAEPPSLAVTLIAAFLAFFSAFLAAFLEALADVARKMEC